MRVWEIEFHSAWTWLNDSSVVKHPLRDLLFIVAPAGRALADALGGNDTDTVEKRNELMQFYERHPNYVRAIIPNPSDPTLMIDRTAADELFSVDKIVISRDGEDAETVRVAELTEVAVPDIGILRALQLPGRLAGKELALGTRLRVEYSGKLRLATERDGEGRLCGRVSYPPSDVVGNEYTLSVAYVEEIEDGVDRWDVGVDRERSGCRYLNGPPESAPAEYRIPGPVNWIPGRVNEWARGQGGIAKVAQVRVDHPLTELYNIELSWSAMTRRRA